MNGKERLYWQQNQQGYVFLTMPESPIKPGFDKFSTVTPSEMDRIYAKLDKQERDRYGKMTEQMYNRDKEFIEQNLSNLRHKMANSRNPQEKDFLRDWLQAFENKMKKLKRNTVYGMAEIQRAEAPLPADNEFVTVDDVRLGKLQLMKPVTEAIQ
jgi:hypothetical protein